MPSRKADLSALPSGDITRYFLSVAMILCNKMDLVLVRPQSNMLKNLPKMLLGISQKFPLLCSIMLKVIIAVRYVYTHNLYN